MDIKGLVLISKPIDSQTSECASLKNQTEGNPNNLNIHLPILMIVFWEFIFRIAYNVGAELRLDTGLYRGSRCSRHGLCGFKLWCHHSQALWLWVRCRTSLSLGLLVCKIMTAHNAVWHYRLIHGWGDHIGKFIKKSYTLPGIIILMKYWRLGFF